MRRRLRLLLVTCSDKAARLSGIDFTPSFRRRLHISSNTIDRTHKVSAGSINQLEEMEVAEKKSTTNKQTNRRGKETTLI
jgi:hypothetical protein